MTITTKHETVYCPGCCHVTDHESMTSEHDGRILNTVSECMTCGYVI